MADPYGRRKLDESISSERHLHNEERKKLISTDYVVKKRRPFGTSRQGNKDIFVNNKTSFKAQIKKCEKLFENGAAEVIIHGLGAAVPKACNLALQLKEIHHGGVELDIKTSTVSIIDDFEPLKDDIDYEVNERQNSAVHIRVFRRFFIGGLKYQD